MIVKPTVNELLEHAENRFALVIATLGDVQIDFQVIHYLASVNFCLAERNIHIRDGDFVIVFSVARRYNHR